MITSNILLPFIVVLTIIGLVIFIRPSVAKHKKSGKGIKIVIGVLLLATVAYTLYDQAVFNMTKSELKMANESVEANLEKIDSIVPKGDSLINQIVIDPAKPDESRIPDTSVDSVVKLNNRRLYISKSVIQNSERNYRDSITSQINTIESQKALLQKDAERYTALINDLDSKVKESKNSVFQTSKTRDYDFELKKAHFERQRILDRIKSLDEEITRLQTVNRKLERYQ